MTVLLDTHALLWWWGQPGQLSERARAIIRDPQNRVVVSAASAWEIATKRRIGKYPQGGIVVDQWQERVAADRFVELPISVRHALRAGALPGDHRDPFDRMLAAQSMLEGFPIVSIDEALGSLGAERLWA